jgi:hypothetical protein
MSTWCRYWLSSVFIGSCDEFGVLTWSRSILYTVLRRYILVLTLHSSQSNANFYCIIFFHLVSTLVVFRFRRLLCRVDLVTVYFVKCSEVNLSVIEPLKMVTCDRNVRRAFV